MDALLTPEKANVKSNGRFTRRAQVAEVCVFLFLIVPNMILSLFVVRTGGISFPLAATMIILRDLALVSLVIFFLGRNGESISSIGWQCVSLGREVTLGAGLFVPFFFGVALVDWLFRSIGLSSPTTPLPRFLSASDFPQLLLAFVLVVVVAVTEETIFRGYLLLRFTAITHSTVAAVGLSSVVFAMGHGYEGTAGLLTVGLMGVCLAMVYVWRGTLAAPIVIHLLQDFMGIVLVPFLGMKS